MNSRMPVRAAAALVVASCLYACGGGGGSDGGGGGGGSGNAPPRFTGPTDFTFAETEAVDFTLTVSDPDSATVTIRSLPGGDASRFVLDTATGRITANTTSGLFDFENPQDSNADNVYTQDVELSDGTNAVRDTITVTITNVDEGPEFPQLGEVMLDENFTGPLLTFNATDPEGATVSGYTIVQVSKLGEPVNADRLVNAFDVDPVTGVLTVVTPFDAEFEGTQDPITVSVEATDGTQVGSGGVVLRLVDLPSQLASGIRISGDSTVSPLGDFANAVGDVDGDGLPELWVSGTTDLAGQEEAWLVWGSAVQARLAGGASDQKIGEYASNEHVRVLGGLRSSTPRQNQLAAVPAGDVDNDGFGDVLVLLREERTPSQVEDVDNGPVAVLLWGRDLDARRPASLDLNALPTGSGTELGGLTRPFAAGINASTADIDGDGASDLLIGTPARNRALVVFGDALSPATAAIDIGTAGSDTVVVIESIDTVRVVIEQIGSVVAGIPDITGDGVAELAIGGLGLEPDLEDGVFVIDGSLVAGAKGSMASINVSDAANDTLVIRMLGSDFVIDSIDAQGDVDADGLADLAIGHTGRNRSARIGSVVTGARLQSLFGTDAELDLDFASRADGVAINDDGFESFLAEAGRTNARWLTSITGGPGSELAFGVGLANPLGRETAGHILLFSDTAVLAESTTILSVDSNQPDPAKLRVLQGYGSNVETGRSLFAADFDGDGRDELGTASLLAGRDDGPRDVGGVVVANGGIASDAFAQQDGAVDLASVLVVEAP